VAKAAQLRAPHAKLRWACADLERFSLPCHAFDVVTCFYYRDPALYSLIRRTIRPGGLLFYETFTCDQLQFERGPRNPDHLLKRGELLNAFGNWDVILYQETSVDHCLAAMVARKPKS
jgi:SAM-dependent methyltransferase